MGIQQMLLGAGGGSGTPQEFDSTDAFDQTYGDSGAYAAIVMYADGSLLAIGNFSSQGVNYWIDPQVGMDNYEVYAVKDSGSTLSGGTLLTWLPLSSSWSWSYSIASVGNKQGIFTFTVRKVGTSTPTWISSGCTIEADANTGDPP